MSEHLVGYRTVMRYRVASRAYFHLPILVPFLAAAGLSVPAVLLMLAVYGAVVAFAGKPVMRSVGALSSTRVLALGECGKAVGLGALLCGSHPATLLLGQVIGALGFSMTIGVDAALAGRLRGGATAREDESAVQMGMFLCSFAAGVAGAVLYSLDHRAPFVASIVVSAGCAVAILLVDADAVARPTQTQTQAANAPTNGNIAAGVRVWQVYYAVSRAVLLVAFTGLVPVLLTMDYRIDVRYIGIALGLYTIGGLVAARSVSRLSEPMVAVATAVPLIVGLALLPAGLAGGDRFGGFVSEFGVLLALALLGIANGFVRPATISALSGLGSVSELGVRAAEMERAQAGIQLALFAIFIVALTGGADHRALCLILIIIGGATQLFAMFTRRRTRAALTLVS